MTRTRRISIACFGSLLLIAGAASAKRYQLVAEPEPEVGIVGPVVDTSPQKALQDTVWIAEWTFDAGAFCTSAGWTHLDNHILNDGAVYWHIELRCNGLTRAVLLTRFKSCNK